MRLPVVAPHTHQWSSPMGKSAERPEALATFAEASRHDGKKPDDLGLKADENTKPIPTSSKDKDRAATKVLQEGVTHEDKGSREAIDKLPDRIVDSRKGDKTNTSREQDDEATRIQDADTRDGQEGQGDRRG
jgi:hypothetical protein